MDSMFSWPDRFDERDHIDLFFDGMSVEDASMIEGLDGMDRNMTSWEADFMESMCQMMDEDRALSVRQNECLERMYNKYFG